MELRTFPHYEAYVKAQRRRRKESTKRVQATEEELDAIVGWCAEFKHGKE